MANEENLKPLNKRAKSVQRKIQSKGGKARAKKIKEQKTYAEMAKAMLSAKITDEELIEEMKLYGIEDTDIKAYTLLGMIKASARGSHNAFDRLMELIGEKEQNENKDVIAKLDSVLNGIDEVMENE